MENEQSGEEDLQLAPFNSTQAQIVKEDLHLPSGNNGKLAFLLHNVLTQQECKELIAKTEKMGYDEALVNIGGGRQQMIPEVRSSKRCIWDSEEYTQDLWNRIKEFIPTVFMKRKVLGLNERLRFLRYDPGDYFKPHYDGMYLRENGERSIITFQLYLNEGFEGGATTFIGTAGETLPVVPRTGMVLIFQHNIYHEGSTLVKGRKYAVRTDIMCAAELTQE